MSKYAFVPKPANDIIDVQLSLQFFEGSAVIFADNDYLLNLELKPNGDIHISGLTPDRNPVLLGKLHKKITGEGWVAHVEN